MSFITLTTDLGLKDYYVPAVKGLLLSKIPGVSIVDITHSTDPFHMAEASMIFSSCFRDFPDRTCHIISVDSEATPDPRFIFVRTARHDFLAMDNGFISLILEPGEEELVVEIPYDRDALIFPLKNILAPAAINLLNGAQPPDLGEVISGYRIKANLRPLLEENIIRGSVVYIDNFGNAVTNIERSHINRYGAGRKYRIYLSRNEYFDEVNSWYGEVQEGEKAAVFGTTGRLEIAINKGNANELLGLKEGRTILIEFL